MKKTLVILLALVFVLSLGTAAFAAPANPFVDVPAKHWAYDAVSKLAKAGIVDGYGDGTFRGDKTISRYEMAQIVAKAMAKSDKADAENKALIDKLAVEFAAELNNLGVRVAALEKKTDNFKVTGDIRPFYDRTELSAAGVKTATYTRNIRTRLYFSGQINDEWTYKARLQNVQNMNTSGSESTADYNLASVTGPIGGAKVTFGRFAYMPMYGVVVDDYMDGIQADFGNVLKVTARYGKDGHKSSLYADGSVNGKPLQGTGANTTYTGLELGYGVTKDTNIKAAYHDYKMNNTEANRIWELGFDSKLSDTVTGYASYSKSNANDLNRGYAIGLAYKAYNVAQPGSFQIYTNYRNLQPFSTWASTYDVSNIGVADVAWLGSKGYELGFYYVPAKNIRWHVEYVDAKATSGVDVKEKYFMTRVNFYF